MANTEISELYAAPCGYFKDRTSHASIFFLPSPEEALVLVKNSVALPTNNIDGNSCQKMVFSNLLAQGFRRSGAVVYLEKCPDCRKCIPIRIHTADFVPSKSQRRLLRKENNICVSVTDNPSDFVTDEKVKLMMMYDKRHDPDTAETSAAVKNTLFQMNGFYNVEGNRCTTPWYSGTVNMEYRLNGRLIGCGIIDYAGDSLSSNYFYYDISPDIMKQSIGIYSILQEILLCRKVQIDWYYLGYWIAGCRKMVYKQYFKPHQFRIDGEWKTSSETAI
jgi:leucyl-tRNA---protein transferase